jgi:aspartate kinase
MRSAESNGVVSNGLLQGNTNHDLGWIVQKFGGTSVGKFADKIAEDVVRYRPNLEQI